MGAPVAGRLLGAGFRLTVFDIRPEATAGLVAAGATRAPSAADAARGAQFVLLSLPSHVEVEQVCLDTTGILQVMTPGAYLIDLTTVSVTLVDKLEKAAREAGVHYLAAPVSQGVDNAALGRLSVFAGGAADDVRACRPLLDAIATQVIHTGTPSTAIAAKLLTNQLWFVHAAALAEALVIGAKSGIDLDTLQQVILHSCGTSWVAEHDIPSVYSGTYDPTFTTQLCLKDLGLIAELAARHDVPVTITDAAHDAFRRAADTYGPDSPELSVVRHLEDVTGAVLQSAQRTPAVQGPTA